MKKRIFIAAHYLEIGGAEISLIGLLNVLDYSKFDVDLFLYSHRGELLPLVPSQVNLLPEIPEYAQMENPIKEVFQKGYWRQGLARIKAKIKYSLWSQKAKPQTPEAYFQYLDEEITPSLPSLDKFGVYDLAINFIALKEVIAKKVKAKKKVAWIHTDLSAITINEKKEQTSWNFYDRIISISPHVTKSFVAKFPALKTKIFEIENILSPSFVRQRANEFDASKDLFQGEIKLLSIGRFAHAKNYDNIPDICRRIINKGLDVVWYIIGFGGDEELIRRKIVESGMEKKVILLGKKKNPYPYIKKCDIYVQPSRYEGKSVTVREAQMLCKPIVVTNYATASSQIKDGVDGRIVPLENRECADALYDFINDKALQHSIIEYLKTNDYGNESEASKIEELL